MNVLKISIENDEDVNLQIIDKEFVIDFLKKGINEDRLKLVSQEESAEKSGGGPKADELEVFCFKCAWRGFVTNPMPQFCPNCRAWCSINQVEQSGQ